MKVRLTREAASLLPTLLMAGAAIAQGSYVNFEGPAVHPIRLSPDGSRLFAANTADNRLSVFDLTNPSNPVLIAEIPVGLEPVSVNARSNDEVWVVNHTSDSVSVVSVAQGIVTDTIQVKDEPCDVVFAGTPQRAFITASRSDEVRAFDPATHAQIATIPLLGKVPRSLAASADGSLVYTTFTMSGNRTTAVPKQVAPPQGPPTNPNLPPPPPVARIVDATDPAWAPSVIQYTVLDHDVAEINANALTLNRYYDRVGTVNFGVAVNPANGDVWVSNTDARNLIRFETNLRGHFVDNRLTKINVGASPVVTPIDLNPGVDYSLLPNLGAKATMLAQPTDIAFEPSGAFLWVAAFGTDRIAKIDASNGSVAARIEVGPTTGSASDSAHMRGPRGLALRSSANRLYAQNRISNTITVIDTVANSVVQELPVGGFDPTPAAIRQGRGFLYDARLSGNGHAACAACHVDGDTDFIAWDLGNPGGTMATVTDPATGAVFNLHPMKGPMLTQHLRNLAGIAPYHWRGDRPNLNAFNGAFDSLMGGAQISAGDMQKFVDFMNTIRMEPNPNQNLDRTLPASVAGVPGNPIQGQNQYNAPGPPPGGPSCASCHKAPLNYTVKIGVEPGLPGAIPGKAMPLRDYYRRANFSLAPGTQNKQGFGFHNDGMQNPFDAGPLQNVGAFFACFDTLMAPAVGWSRTVTAANATSAALTTPLATVLARAAAGDCDVVIKGRIDGVVRGLLYQPAAGQFVVDKTGVGPFTWTQLQSKAVSNGATFTILAVPPGSGTRIGVDRDLDGVLDGDEPTSPHVVAYGASTAGCGGLLTIGTNSAPQLGNAYFAFTCTHAPASALGLGLAGDVADNGGSPLAGFTLYVSLASNELYGFDFLSDSTGFGACEVPLPASPALNGFTYYAQAVWADPCSPEGLSASNAVAVTLFQ